MQIEGQTALVTGANRGFGRHLAQQLRDRGATVYAGARQSSSRLVIESASNPAASQRFAKNGTCAVDRARSRRRRSCTRSIASGDASQAVSKYSGGGGNARTSSW